MKKIILIFLLALFIILPSLVLSADEIPSDEKPDESFIGWLWNGVKSIWEYWFKGEVTETSEKEPEIKPIVLEEMHEKDAYPDKFQTIQTQYVKFEMPKEATHYWTTAKGDNDLYEIILHNVSVDGKDSILRLTWNAPRYQTDTINIDYNFKDGVLNAQDIVPYSKLGKASSFNGFKVETGSISGYTKKEETNWTCVNSVEEVEDVFNETTGELIKEGISNFEIFDKCKYTLVTPTYSWKPYEPITTTLGTFKAIDDVNVSACGTLSTAGENYTVNQTVTSTGTCFTINAVNIGLTCSPNVVINYGNQSSATDYYGIRNDASDGFRASNCTIRQGNLATLASTRMGVSVVYGIFNNIDVSYNWRGMTLAGTSNVANNITATNTRTYGVLVNGNYANVSNVDISNSYQRGITSGTGVRNRWINISGTNCSGTSATYACIQVVRTNNGYFENIYLNRTVGLARGIHIHVDSASFDTLNNTFVNVYINNTIQSSAVYVQDSGRRGFNNSFVNATYDQSQELVIGTDAQLLRRWYYQAYVNDSGGVAKTGVNVSANNRTTAFIFNMTTSSGYTPVNELQDYSNQAGTRIYSSNYNITITNVTLTDIYPFNVTINENNIHYMTLSGSDHFPPALTVNSPTITQYTSTTNFTVTSNENLSWCGLSLDGSANYTMSLSAIPTVANLTNSTMIDGSHNFAVACNDTSGNVATVFGTSFLTDLPTITKCRTLSRSISYNLINNLYSTLPYCLVPSNDSMKINGNGYNITGGPTSTIGFYTTIARVNLTIYNFTIRDFSLGQAISIGIINSSIIDMNFINVSRALTLTSSNNNVIRNIFINGSFQGSSFTLSIGNNNTIENLYYTDSSSTADGMYLLGTTINNTFRNITAIRCNGIGSACIKMEGIGSSAGSNLFENVFINNSIGYGIYIIGGFFGPNGYQNDNLFKDVYIENTSLPSVRIDNSGAGSANNNTFLNATYSTQSVSGTQNVQLIRKWYYQAYVNDTRGNPISNVNVSAFNRTSSIESSRLTDSNGYTSQDSLTEYVSIIGSTVYSTPHSTTADYTLISPEFMNETTSWNVSLEKNNIEYFTLNVSDPYVYSPTNTGYSGIISINYTEFVPAVGKTLDFYNISLLDSSSNYLSTIVTDNGANLGYYLDSTSLPNGNYIIRVEACDNTALCVFGYSKVFTISNFIQDRLYIMPEEKTFSTGQIANVTARCRFSNGSDCTDQTDCRLTSYYPNKSILVDNAFMTNYAPIYSYNFGLLSQLGAYNSIIYCYNHVNGTASFNFDITSPENIAGSTKWGYCNIKLPMMDFC